MNKDSLNYALNSLRGRTTRTFLTTLSIVIGIMAIFTLISFGQGLSSYVGDLADEMGVDKVMIQPKSNSAIPEDGLTKEDLEFIDKIKGVSVTAGMMLDAVKVEQDKNSEDKYTYLAGIPTTTEANELISQLMTVEVEEGRDLKKGDKLKVVLGSLYAEEGGIFDKRIEVGQKIIVNDKKVEVLGFYEEIGNPQDDSQVYISLEGFRELIDVEIDSYGMIAVSTEKGTEPAELATRIKEKLRKFRDVEKGEEDFSVNTFEEMIEQFSTIINVLNMILVMIALISVFISAINIMNTMYTSVLERTKDIGIMKAIGAKNKDILSIFLFESGVLGLLGGGIGVLLGYLISSAGGQIAAASGYALLQPAFPPELIIGCLLFSTVVGAIAGMAPAIQASKQKPVDSLRYE